MKIIFGIMTAASVWLVGSVDVARAQNYPWCAQYGYRDGARNCGFVSWAQCMATVSGIGGYCEHNAMYRPQDNVRPRKPRRPR
jgi:hypothetical protein